MKEGNKYTINGKNLTTKIETLFYFCLIMTCVSIFIYYGIFSNTLIICVLQNSVLLIPIFNSYYFHIKLHSYSYLIYSYFNRISDTLFYFCHIFLDCFRVIKKPSFNYSKQGFLSPPLRVRVGLSRQNRRERGHLFMPRNTICRGKIHRDRIYTVPGIFGSHVFTLEYMP